MKSFLSTILYLSMLLNSASIYAQNNSGRNFLHRAKEKVAKVFKKEKTIEEVQGLVHCGVPFNPIGTEDIKALTSILSSHCAELDVRENFEHVSADHLCACSNDIKKNGTYKRNNKEAEEEIAKRYGGEYIDQFHIAAVKNLREISSFIKDTPMSMSDKEEIAKYCAPDKLFTVFTQSSPCGGTDLARRNLLAMRSRLNEQFGSNGNFMDELNEKYLYEFHKNFLSANYTGEGFARNQVSYTLRGDSSINPLTCFSPKDAASFQQLKNRKKNQAGLKFLIDNKDIILNSLSQISEPKDIIKSIGVSGITPFPPDNSSSLKDSILTSPFFAPYVKDPETFKNFMTYISSNPSGLSNDVLVGDQEELTYEALIDPSKNPHIKPIKDANGNIVDYEVSKEYKELQNAILSEKIDHCKQMSVSMENFACSYVDTKIGDDEESFKSILTKYTKDTNNDPEKVFNMTNVFCRDRDKKERDLADVMAFNSLRSVSPSSSGANLADEMNSNDQVFDELNNDDGGLCSFMMEFYGTLPDQFTYYNAVPDGNIFNGRAYDEARVGVQSFSKQWAKICKPNGKTRSDKYQEFCANPDFRVTFSKYNAMKFEESQSMTQRRSGSTSTNVEEIERSKSLIANTSPFFNNGKNQKVLNKMFHDLNEAKSGTEGLPIEQVAKNDGGGYSLSSANALINSNPGRSPASFSSTTSRNNSSSSVETATNMNTASNFNKPATNNPTFNPGLAASANTFSGQFDKEFNDLSNKVNSSDKITNKPEVNAELENLRNQIANAQKELDALKGASEIAQLQSEKDEIAQQMKDLKKEQNKALNQAQHLANNVNQAVSSDNESNVEVAGNTFSNTNSNRTVSNNTAGTTGGINSNLAYAGGSGGSAGISGNAPTTISDQQFVEGQNELNIQMRVASQQFYDSKINVDSSNASGVKVEVPTEAVNDNGELNLSPEQFKFIIVKMKEAGQSSVVVDIDKLKANATYKIEGDELKLVDYTQDGQKLDVDTDQVPTVIHNFTADFNVYYKDADVSDTSITARANAGETSEVGEQKTEVPQDASAGAARNAKLKDLEQTLQNN